MKENRINKKDKYRVLLTEVWPYEVPLIVSNNSFYKLVKDKSNENFIKKIKETHKDYIERKVPYHYNITNKGSDTRAISIMHPLSQTGFIELYEKHDLFMVYLCSRSPFSLRSPKGIAKYFFVYENQIEDEEELLGPQVETEIEDLHKEARIFRSYFTYGPIDLLYKFYGSRDYLKFEKRFSNLLCFDVSKCFYNIYTHTISWAIKGKGYSKRKRNKDKDSFDAMFDKLMQDMNDGETNGILVGPEVSRIFAEIILQRVDLNCLARLSSDEFGYKVGVTYDVRRYVDDYFVFSNESVVSENVMRVFSEELHKYKLFINNSKVERFVSPFSTNIDVGKSRISSLWSDFIGMSREIIDEDLEGVQREIYNINPRPKPKAHRFIQDMRILGREVQTNFEAIAKEVLRSAKKELYSLSKVKNRDNIQGELGDFIVALLEVAFYSYSFCLSNSSTFKMSNIIYLSAKIVNTYASEDVRMAVFSCLYQLGKEAIENVVGKTQDKGVSVEMLNLLVGLREIKEFYPFSSGLVEHWFGYDVSSVHTKLNYFQIVCLLYYFENEQTYLGLKNRIVHSVVKSYQDDSEWYTRADGYMLFIDLMTCPYLDWRTKYELMVAARMDSGKCGFSESRTKKQVVELTQGQNWFVSWGDQINLEAIFKSKEFQSAY
jgi:hypothetical protein